MSNNPALRAELNMGWRAHSCCAKEGIHTVAQLVAKTEMDLLRIPNLGRGTLREIKDELARHGLSLRPEEPDFTPKVSQAQLAALAIVKSMDPIEEPEEILHTTFKTADEACAYLTGQGYVMPATHVSEYDVIVWRIPKADDDDDFVDRVVMYKDCITGQWNVIHLDGGPA